MLFNVILLGKAVISIGGVISVDAGGFEEQLADNNAIKHKTIRRSDDVFIDEKILESNDD
jgi:hypothetical protein